MVQRCSLVASQVQTKATVDLYSFLDGQNTQWTPTIALSGTQQLTAMVDGLVKENFCPLAISGFRNGHWAPFK